ncbi:hypothetical protein KHS38_18875 [Mucilaginibacter sp. Bleaf8]|uniref:hypothetical protein n=1 Tax=Mucilaginibacter sp. Bleaf8 TaxID=2834430 RepID=UPI001BCC2740|nr:hypothetical protein [Mucilaginibacter sp. Bleaf8]MBS7566476.1 hypothetical protein [Mucilaginibacter sp. Bleaf8]
MKAFTFFTSLILLVGGIAHAQSQTPQLSTSAKLRADRIISESQIQLHLTDKQKKDLYNWLYNQNVTFDSLRNINADKSVVIAQVKANQAKLAEILSQEQVLTFQNYLNERRKKK